MDRRKAIKNMGKSLGYVVAMPTLLSIVKSCKAEDKAMEWVPDFFTKEQGALLISLVDILLPRTDTPSASEVQVHLFIDKFSQEVMTKKQQDFTRLSLEKFLEKTLKNSTKTSYKELNENDLEHTLAIELQQNTEAKKLKEILIENYNKEIEEKGNSTISSDVASYAFANQLRGLTIWGYKTSEYIGEEVLAYLPIPGEYIPCEDLNKLTNGKAWSD